MHSVHQTTDASGVASGFSGDGLAEGRGHARLAPVPRPFADVQGWAGGMHGAVEWSHNYNNDL